MRSTHSTVNSPASFQHALCLQEEHLSENLAVLAPRLDIRVQRRVAREMWNAVGGVRFSAYYLFDPCFKSDLQTGQLAEKLELRGI